MNGGRWNKLGTFTLDRDSKVVLSNTANGTVIADAVTLLPAGTTPKPLAEGDTASWSLTRLEPGEYDIYASWPQGPRHATDARYRIYHTQGLDEIPVNQQTGGHAWHRLGSYRLNSTSKVVLSSVANGLVVADALSVLPRGTPAETSNGHTAVWQLTLASEGEYTLSARWPAHPTNASAALYRITHQAGIAHVSVNQRRDGGQWVELGTYRFDQNSRVELLPQGNGQVIADAIRLSPDTDNLPTARLYYVHTDHLGTPQVLTDDNQQVVWQAEYEPFGKATVTTETVTNNIRFPGQYYDQETGLHYNYFRYYDPSIGRYITSDPIGLDGGINTYGYVGANPLSYEDFFGLKITGEWAKSPSLEYGDVITRGVEYNYNVRATPPSVSLVDTRWFLQGRVSGTIECTETC